MKIAVCIKQVPVVSRIKFDYESKTIVREGVPLEVNSFDLLAVDRAVELGKESAAEVVVFTMGPSQAREALIQCLAMGAHRAVHLTDRAMSGSDTLATARSLALALKREGFDPQALEGSEDRDWLIFCGRNSTDAETGQVGPEIAELLHIPYVGNVRKLEYSIDNGSIVVERVTDEGYELIQCPLPALISVTEGIMEERWPSRQEMEAARARAEQAEVENPVIQEVGSAQLSPDNPIFGAAGSPTWVAEIRLVEPQRLGVVIEESDPQVAAQRLVEGLMQRSETATPTRERRWPGSRGQRERAIWVVAERVGQSLSQGSGPSASLRTSLRRTTFELLGKARELVEWTYSEVAAVLIGHDNEEDVKALAAYGADRVLILDNSALGHPIGLACTSALARAIHIHNPYAILFPSTANGRDLASRVAARLGLGLTGDCIDLEIDEEGELVQLKPALGGNVVAPIRSRTRPYMATLRPGLLTPVEPDWELEAEVEALEEAPDAGRADIKVLEVHAQEDARGLELEAARTVMGVGMGVGGPENLATIYSLAQSIGATVAASRNVTDAGWLPKQIQVGLTGRAIAPDLYIAVGIRGDFNHMVGVQKAGTILSINNNPNPRRSPIFQAADFSIVGDWRTYLPPLVEALKPLLKQDAK